MFMSHYKVIKELPKKNQRIEWCELNDTQTTLYHTATLPDGKGIIADATVSMGHTDSAKGSNVLMNLRKASLHPMLFRTQFSEQMLQSAARVLMKQNDIATPYELILAELQVMTDAELQMYFTQRKVRLCICGFTRPSANQYCSVE
jgi:SWI/SNF-related matrix-associated actin-dependent regulator of chromatin subfamily A containing DEAD/H box 1